MSELQNKENVLNQLFGGVKNEAVGFDDDGDATFSVAEDDDGIEIVGGMSLTGSHSAEEAKAIADEVTKRFEAYCKDPRTGKMSKEKIVRGFKQIISKVEQEKKEKEDREKFVDDKEAEKELADFMAARAVSASLKVGDLVVRNEYGIEKYKLPLEHQAMVIEEIYPEYRPEGGEVPSFYNARVSCATSRKMVVQFNVDLAYYKKKV